MSWVRTFADSDTAASPHVGIVNEEFAKRFLPNQNPLGHVVGPTGINWNMTITVEIGVRIAVGAQRSQVVWMVLRDSLVLTAFGVTIGIPLALLVGRALTSTLYGVKPYDVTSYVFSALGVALVAIAASVIPSRRAASIDPLTALRSE